MKSIRILHIWRESMIMIDFFIFAGMENYDISTYGLTGHRSASELHPKNCLLYSR